MILSVASLLTHEQFNPQSTDLSIPAARRESRVPSRTRRLRSRGGLGFKVAKRRLSDRGAPESTGRLAACGETIGNIGGDDHREEELEPLPSRRVRGEDEGSDADIGVGPSPKTSGGGQEVFPGAAAAATAFEADSPLESRVSPEVMAAQALIALGDEQSPVPLEQPVRGSAFPQQALLAPCPQQQAPPPPPPQQAQLLASQPQALLVLPSSSKRCFFVPPRTSHSFFLDCSSKRNLLLLFSSKRWLLLLPNNICFAPSIHKRSLLLLNPISTRSFLMLYSSKLRQHPRSRLWPTLHLSPSPQPQGQP
ncbi:hypothetical protein ACSSS7_000392 [Eimeria intestinalis]